MSIKNGVFFLYSGFSKLMGVLLGFIFCFPVFSQNIVINEVSQGVGASEYVELLITGTPNCGLSPSMDLRGWIIDDNNGTFALGGGTGIAKGAVRFSNNVFWSDIKLGTFIVIYNDLSVNTNLPANDIDKTDGNCRLVIPVGSTLLEHHPDLPEVGNPSYAPTGWISGGLWSKISMNNNDDSFQVLDAGANPVHSVSWGNNTNNVDIYFSGTASGLVFYNQGSNPHNQSDWIVAGVGGNESPGLSNTSGNNAWIVSMNNNCQDWGITATLHTNNDNCLSACQGSASVTPSQGIAPYTYLWSDGSTLSNVSGLCAGNYTLTLTDAMGCADSFDFSIQSATAFSYSVLLTEETCFGECDGTILITANGTGNYSYSIDNGAQYSSNADFYGLCPGLYPLQVKNDSGCVLDQTAEIKAGPVSEDCQPVVIIPTEKESPKIYVPNAFTPNGDKYNGDFGPIVYHPEALSQFELVIFNRWGSQIFSTNDLEKRWDGNLNGKPAKQDVYLWKINYNDKVEKEKVVRRGSVALIR